MQWPVDRSVQVQGICVRHSAPRVLFSTQHEELRRPTRIGSGVGLRFRFAFSRTPAAGRRDTVARDLDSVECLTPERDSGHRTTGLGCNRCWPAFHTAFESPISSLSASRRYPGSGNGDGAKIGRMLSPHIGTRVMAGKQACRLPSCCIQLMWSSVSR
jgi:hypothetical protein